MKPMHYFIIARRFSKYPLVLKVKEGTQYMFHRRLLLTNIGISAAISATADCIEQRIKKHRDPERKYELMRTFDKSMWGATLGIVSHYWYIWLERFFPGRTFKMAMKKMTLDIVVGSSISLCIFFMTMALLERTSHQFEWMDELRSTFWRLYLTELVIWTPAQLINFMFLPLRFRVLYVFFISLWYDVYRSYVVHGRK